MAIWCKAITCGTIASAAIVYYIIKLHRRGKKEMDVNNHAFEVEVINTSLSDTRAKRQIFAKNSTNPNNMPLISKIRQVVSPLSNKSTSNNPVKSSRNKRLYQMQSKAVEDCNSIMQNSVRSFTHSETSESVVLNNSASSFEHGLGNAQDNFNHSVVIHINNSIDSTTNKIQIKAFNRSIKLSTLNIKTLHISDDFSAKNRSADSIMISQKDEPKETNIMIPSLNRRRFVERFMTFRGNRLTNVRNNKCTKEMERHNITIIIN
ncbi:PREDICTED: uncharacterized protein LOC105455975 [Wasmannia auropunctata]|uniref:uncharacterized protein LOC105455975 n=1 Tax=Wasmannia auropunctata TaxID=64793 RepID=UPI0005EE2D9D|nr:PREDICTED: uncharacterized protein LOC105455975 [Wasmannia auropunctata]